MNGETWTQANARRACLGCGESEAHLYLNRDTGKKTRVCNECSRSGFWDYVSLAPREPIAEEGSRMHDAEWIAPHDA